MAKVELVRTAELADAPQTPSLTRRQAFASEGVWIGVATMEAHSVTGWHHHGNHTTYVYVASGHPRIESGPGGRDVLEAAPGDFVKIPTRTIHRESNRRKEKGLLIVFRLGSGPTVENTEGPETE